jgi:tripartite ATP-independent transporter DctP family solute receptor
MSVKQALIALGIAALLQATPAGAQEIKLRLGEIYPESHSNSQGARKFADLVAAKTGGKVAIDVFIDGTLGNEREIAEGVVSSVIDIAPSGMGGIGRYAAPLQVLELPYIYKDIEHLSRVADALLPDADALLKPKGVRAIGYFVLGPRDIASNRPITKLADLKGMKLRVPESPLYVGMAQALGASPTPVSLSETYTSLQTGVVDAAEGDPAALFSTRFYEPAKNVANTEHIWHVRWIVMSETAFDRLSEEQHGQITEAAREAKDFQIQKHIEGNAQALAGMEKAGVNLTKIENREEFVEALKSFNTSFAARLGGAAETLFKKAQAVQ